MTSARDTVYAELRHRLTSGRYAVDDRLVPAPLAEEFSVSRTPVREALGLLERDGLLEATPRGYAVRHRSDEEMLEIFEARAILDSAAAAAAAGRRSDVDLARLEDLAAAARDAGDPARVRAAFNEWHDALRHAAHNGTIRELLRTLEAQAKTCAPWRTPFGEHTFDATHADHAAILAAVRAQDAAEAQRLMQVHHDRDRDTRIRQLAADRPGAGTGPHLGDLQH